MKAKGLSFFLLLLASTFVYDKSFALSIFDTFFQNTNKISTFGKLNNAVTGTYVNFSLENVLSKVNYSFRKKTNTGPVDHSQNLDPLSQSLNNYMKENNSDYNSFEEEQAVEESSTAASPTDKTQITKDVADFLTPFKPGDKNAPTPDSICSDNGFIDKNECKKGVFQGCAESIYEKQTPPPECVKFPTADYVKYIQAKNNLIQNPGQKATPVQTSVGPITPSPYVPSPNTTQNSAINGQPYTPTPQQQQQFNAGQQNQFPNNTIPAQDTSKFTNAKAPVMPGKDGWIEGKGTVYCVGEKCNPTTAMGMDPKGRLISLPYKTIDSLFGTKTDCLVKKTCSGNLAAEYAKVRGRAIEVEMIKNGKKGIFPLGDVGPAEWTGNAIDFTGPSCKELGCSGKDQVRFRATPQSSSSS
jgi:hypothetical protein